ncbi:MAG: ABC transporter ATP-binding protein [bacterium]|nr:ABC transporter ATP-binding protein [bacterium]
MSEIILELANFSKSFRSHWTYAQKSAVIDVCLGVYRGEAFGYIGHNGAGKTTTIKCILGLIRASSGSIKFSGSEINAEQRKKIGYLPEQPYFYDHLSVRETLLFLGGLHGLRGPVLNERVDKTLAQVKLDHRANSPVRTLSKGLQQRLGFAQAIINDPELLILDEPFSGLDPIGRREIREEIIALNKTGTTIFMSSHILSDVEDVCDRVAIMARGRLKQVINIKEEHLSRPESVIITFAVDRLNPVFKESAVAAGALIVERAPYATIELSDIDSANNLLQTAIANNMNILDYSLKRPDLEEIFFRITEDGQ